MSKKMGVQLKGGSFYISVAHCDTFCHNQAQLKARMQRLRELKNPPTNSNKIWPIASSAQSYAQKAHLKASIKRNNKKQP